MLDLRAVSCHHRMTLVWLHPEVVPRELVCSLLSETGDPRDCIVTISAVPARTFLSKRCFKSEVAPTPGSSPCEFMAFSWQPLDARRAVCLTLWS